MLVVFSTTSLKRLEQKPSMNSQVQQQIQSEYNRVFANVSLDFKRSLANPRNRDRFDMFVSNQGVDIHDSRHLHYYLYIKLLKDIEDVDSKMGL
jgi:hypothetical protein